MKKNIAMKWVKALRSGKYKQGRKALRNIVNDSYCCLGVLCDISKQHEWILTEGLFAYGYYTTVLDDDVLEWSGMRDAVGEHRGVSGQGRSLVGYNDEGDLDGTPCTFDKIADWIEINYKAL